MNNDFARMVGDYLQDADVREERRTLAQRIIAGLGVVCLLVLILIAATWPTKANAEEIPLHVLEDQGVSIRLMPGPCTDSVSLTVISKNVPPQYLARFRAVESVWPEKDGSRKAYPGCWAAFTPDETGAPVEVIVVAFSDGSFGIVPKSQFNKVRGGRGA